MTGSIGVYIFLAIGVLMIIGGIWSFIKDKKFFKTAVMIKGEIVNYIYKKEYNKDNGGRRHTNNTYAPIIKYEYNGQTRQFQGGYSSKFPVVGSSVDVAVDPNNIDKARVKSFIEVYGSLAFVLFGIIFAVVAILQLTKGN